MWRIAHLSGSLRGAAATRALSETTPRGRHPRPCACQVAGAHQQRRPAEDVRENHSAEEHGTQQYTMWACVIMRASTRSVSSARETVHTGRYAQCAVQNRPGETCEPVVGWAPAMWTCVGCAMHAGHELKELHRAPAAAHRLPPVLAPQKRAAAHARTSPAPTKSPCIRIGASTERRRMRLTRRGGCSEA